MDDFLSIARRSRLFVGIAAPDVEALLQCLSAHRRSYAKGEAILHAGDPVRSLGMVVLGGASVVKEDFWGNRNILARIQPGELFAETFACVEGVPLSVSVFADVPSEILFMDAHRIMTACSAACEFHSRLMRNLFAVLAAKNLMLNEKLTHITQRTIREKLLSYLSAESARRGAPSFAIPFNRQELADYLSVDRSALSNELCKLRNEGLLEFNRNHFELRS